MLKKDYNLYFCFIDGEPFIYQKDIKKYISIDINERYLEVLEYVKEKTKDLKNRPQMLDIWKILSQFFNADTYSLYYSKKTNNIENSFENRFTLDISNFLDTIFKRGKSNKEKEMLRKYNSETNIKFSTPDWAKVASEYKHKKNKYGRRYFRH